MWCRRDDSLGLRLPSCVSEDEWNFIILMGDFMKKCFTTRLAGAFAVLLLLLSTGASLHAQQDTAAIAGVVSDSSGGAISGAKVEVKEENAAVTRETTTGPTGFYQFVSLPPGTYNVKVEMAGFRTAVADSVVAVVSSTKHLDFQLQIGAVTESVTVTEGVGPTINTSDATIGNAFDSNQILSLPFEGRDAAGVLSLQPGIAFIGGNVDDNLDTRNGALNGGRSDQANITLDGVDNNQQLRGTAFQGALRSTLDSIEEFRVTTAGENAEAGRSSGGQVALVTKSGTNTFHGAVFEQYRPTNMAANDWFNKHNELNAGEPNVRPKFLRNTFGGAIGGPIKKDRLFFFYTYEGQRREESKQVFRSVPTASMRDGVFFYPCATASDCPGGSVNGVSGTPYAVPAGQFGIGPTQIAQMDANCSKPVPGFPQGSCPQGPGVDPSVLATLNQYPAATPGASACVFFDGFNNVGCNVFASPTPLRENTNIAKIDYNVNRSGTHRIFVRANYQVDSNSDVEQFLGGPPTTITRDHSKGLAVGYTAVLKPTLVNSFRYGYIRQDQTEQGLQTTPIVEFRIFDDLVPLTPTRAFQFPVHNWVDDVSWTKGKHTLQFGTNVRLINNIRSSNLTSYSNASLNPGFLTVQPTSTKGSLDPTCKTDQPTPPAFCTWSFPEVDGNNTAIYNNSISSLTGLITQGNANYNFTKTGDLLGEGVPVPRHFRAWESEWYFQDSWRIKSNLTITAGLRYSLLQPPYETTGTQAAPDISLHDLVDQRARAMQLGQVVNPLMTFNLSGQANGKKPYWDWDYKNLGPRLAIAYSPSATGGLWGALFGGPGKTSIRAGFGIVYDHFGESVVDSFDQTGTFGLTTAISNPTNQTVDTAPRFVNTTTIPTDGTTQPLIFPAPPGGFPATPPASLQLFGGLGLDDKLKTPYSELVDFSVSRELPGGFIFEATYVGRFAHRLLEQRDLAMPLNLKDTKSNTDYFTAAKQFAQLFNSGTDVNSVPKIPYWENLFPSATGVDTSAIAGYCGAGAPPPNPTATQSLYELYTCNIGPGTFGESNGIFIIDAFCFPACANINGVDTPNAYYLPQFSTLYGWSSFAKSSYNAGQFSLRSKPTHGLQFDFNYTYSRSTDTGSEAERVPTFGGLGSAAVVNTWDPNQLYGPSDFDIRHAINSNWLYELPFGRGKRFGHDWNRALDAIAGGWQLSGLLRWSTGFPFSLSNAFPGGTGPFPTNFNLPGFATQIGSFGETGRTTDADGDPNVFKQGAQVAHDAFRFDFAGESGNRNELRGQGFFGSDLGVNKTFRITERQSLRFSAYAFNFTNSVRFDAQSILNSFPQVANLGKYTGTLTTSRRLEFVLRYQF
jgi:hypothetical protein